MTMLREIRSRDVNAGRRAGNRSGVFIACVCVYKSSEIATRVRGCVREYARVCVCVRKRERERKRDRGRVINLFIRLRISVSRGNQVLVIRARATLLLRRLAVRAIEFSCAVDGPTIDTCENDGIELVTVRAREAPGDAESIPPAGADRPGIHCSLLRPRRSEERKKKRKMYRNGGEGSIPAYTEMCNYVIDTRTHIYTHPRSGAARRGDCKLL